MRLVKAELEYSVLAETATFLGQHTASRSLQRGAQPSTDYEQPTGGCRRVYGRQPLHQPPGSQGLTG